MWELVKEGHPDRILLALLNPAIARDFISMATDDDFTEAICALDPEYFISPFRDLHYHLNPSMETQPTFRTIKSFEERTNTFLKILRNLIADREAAARTIPLGVYRHLLKSAAVCGRADLAKDIFYQSLPEDHLVPDRACYNYLMEASAWNNLYGGRERHKLRVTADRLEIRSRIKRHPNYTSHGVTTPSNPENPDSIRLQVLKIFNDLVRQQISGDEATFCHLMIAMGREGDMKGVKSVMKSVWNIDVDALNKHDEKELELPIVYELDSILRPSERLLFTIAHIFSSNNQVETASTLLEYVSRHYKIKVPNKIWNHLLGWAYSIFSQGRPWHRKRGLNIGRPSAAAVESLFVVLQGEPYNIKFGIIPLHYRIRVRLAKRVLDVLLDDVRLCRQQLDEDRLALANIYDRMQLVMSKYDQTHQNDLATETFLNLRREYILTSLRVEAHLQLMIKDLRNIFKETYFPEGRKIKKWAWQRLPNLILEFSEFLPNLLPYYTPTGHVVLSTKQHRTQAIRESNGFQTRQTATLRNMLDTFSPFKLMKASWAFSCGEKATQKYIQDMWDPYSEDLLTDWAADDEMKGRLWRQAEPAYRAPMRPAPEWPESGWTPWRNSSLSQAQHMKPHRVRQQQRQSA